MECQHVDNSYSMSSMTHIIINSTCQDHSHHPLPAVDPPPNGCASPSQMVSILMFQLVLRYWETWEADAHCGDSCQQMLCCMVQVELWHQASLTVPFCLLLLSSTSLTSFPVNASLSCPAATKHFPYRKCPSGRTCMPSWASFSCL